MLKNCIPIELDSRTQRRFESTQYTKREAFFGIRRKIMRFAVTEVRQMESHNQTEKSQNVSRGTLFTNQPLNYPKRNKK